MVTDLRVTGVTAPKRKRSRRGVETEQKFLDAANEVFWASGFSGATISQFVETGGLSVGSFYHLFADKNELLERATQRLVDDFNTKLEALDFRRATNHDLFTLFYRMSIAGRRLVAHHRGIYRATSERVQSDFEGKWPLTDIVPNVVDRVLAVIPEYAEQLGPQYTDDRVAHAVQLISMTSLQTEMGMGALFPQDLQDYGVVISRAACGIVGYVGQTSQLMIDNA